VEHFDPPTGHLGGGSFRGGDTQKGQNPFDQRTLKKVFSWLSAGPVI